MQDDATLIENRIATDESPKLLTARDLATRLSIDLKKVYRLVDSGEIQGIRVGGQWRFIWEDVLGRLKQRSCYGIEGS